MAGRGTQHNLDTANATYVKTIDSQRLTVTLGTIGVVLAMIQVLFSFENSSEAAD